MYRELEPLRQALSAELKAFLTTPRLNEPYTTSIASRWY